METLHIVTQSILINPNQPRKHYSEESIKELGESMLKVGQIQAIGVRAVKRDDTDIVTNYEIIYGERRFRAAQLMNIPLLECKILEITDDQIPDIQLIENLQRENLPPLDEAAWLEELQETKRITDEQLAERVGKPVMYVRERLALLDLVDSAKDKVAKGIIPVKDAAKIASLPVDQQEQAIKRIIIPVTVGEESSEVYDGKRALKAFFDNDILTPLKSADFDTKDAKLLPCGSCTLCPKRSGNSLFGDIMDDEQCTDRACYHDKSVRHYQQLQFNLSKKKKTEVVFAERHYGVEKSFKDLGELIAFSDFTLVTESEAKGKDNARYAIFVGTNSTSNEERIRHGWIILNEKATEKDKADKKKKEADAKVKAEQLSEAEERIVKINVYKKFVEHEEDNQGLMFVDLACNLWEQIDTTTPFEIIHDLISRYELSFKLDVFVNNEWTPITLDKKYVKPEDAEVSITADEFREAVDEQVLAKKQFAFLCDLQFIAASSKDLNSAWLKTMDIDIAKIREGATTKAKEVVKESTKAKKQRNKVKAAKAAKKKK